MSEAIAPIKRAKLRVTEVARLLHVSRPTASNWFNGVHEPHAMIRGKLNKLLDAIGAALEAGELPVPPTVIGKDARWDYINKVLVKYLAPRPAQ